ncbi:MAG: hypothetical protein Q8903_01595 [Bacteroidota bacterium]|nr:hypothetical protein [Bacteroidota bacterium]
MSSEDERSLLLGRFRSFGKENFQPDENPERNILTLVKENSKFLSFSLSSNISEVFIRLEEAPLYWVYDSPLIQYIEDYLKFHVLSEGLNEHYKTIKEFYCKWAIIKSDAERQYFSSSAVKIIEKFSNKNNFLYKIYLGVIYIYEKTQYNPEKGFELLKSAENVINDLNLNDKFKDELLYILNIFLGFAYLKEANPHDAIEKFQKALTSRPYGVTAKFYLSYSEIKCNNLSVANSLLEEILQYDIVRAQQGVEAASIGMFHYLNSHCVFKNVFFYNEFSVLIYDIEELVLRFKEKFKKLYTSFSSRYEKLKILKLNEYYDDDIIKYFSFFSKYEQSVNKNNLFNMCAAEIMNQKLDFGLNSIMEGIRTRFYSTLAESLQMFDSQLIDLAKRIEKTNNEIANEKTTYKEKLAEAIIDLEKKVNVEIQNVENQINDLPNEKTSDAKSAFASTMTYNFVFSSIVFLMGGSAGYSGTTNAEFANDLHQVLSQIVITGLKWSAISFLLGFIIALVSSGMAIVERQNKKQRLIQKISYLKSFKERRIEAIKNEYEKKSQFTISALQSHLEKQVEKQVSLIKEREEAESKLKEEIEQKIAAEVEFLKPLMPNTEAV